MGYSMGNCKCAGLQFTRAADCSKNNDGFGPWFDSADTNTIIELFYYGHLTEASKIQHVSQYSAQKMSPTAEPNNVEAI